MRTHACTVHALACTVHARASEAIASCMFVFVSSAHPSYFACTCRSPHLCALRSPANELRKQKKPGREKSPSEHSRCMHAEALHAAHASCALTRRGPRGVQTPQRPCDLTFNSIFSPFQGLLSFTFCAVQPPFSKPHISVSSSKKVPLFKGGGPPRVPGGLHEGLYGYLGPLRGPTGTCGPPEGPTGA